MQYESAPPLQTRSAKGAVLVYAIMAVCIILLFWRFSKQNYERITSQNAVYAEDVARQTADRVDDQFENALELIKSYAYFLEETGAAPMFMPGALKEISENTPFDGLRFTDADGIDHSSSAEVIDLSDRDFFKRGMQGETGISITMFSPIYQQPVITFFTPFIVEGKILGVLHGSYLADSYLPHLLNTTFFGEKAEVFLCGPDGGIIASSSNKQLPGSILDALKEQGLITEASAPLVEETFKKGGGAVICAPEAKASTISILHIPHQQYYLVQAFPEAVTSAMAARANRGGIELEIALLLLFGLHAAYLLWRAHKQARRLIREGREKAHVINATNTLFDARYVLCDLEKGAYQYIAESEPSNPDLPRSGLYEDFLESQAVLFAEADERGGFLSCFNAENLREHLSTTDFQVYECKVVRNGKEEWDNLNAICIDRDEQGKPRKMIYMRQNITDKKTREIRLEKTLSIKNRKERQYRLAATTSAIFSYEFNVSKDLLESDITIAENGRPNSLLTRLNLTPPCRASEFVRALQAHAQEDSREEFSALGSMEHLLERFKSGQRELDLEYWENPEEGGEKCVRLSFYMIRDEDSGDVMALVVARDITNQVMRQRRQTRALEDALSQARHANEAKTTFLSNMSHDIRTPMNAIIGFSSMALSHLDNRGQARDALSKVLSASNHLLSLINDILDMSRIESGKMQIREQECNISELMHNLLNIIQPQVKAKQLQLFIDTYEVVNEDIITDPLKLNQIFINLLGNAVKYTPAGGFVSFRIRQSPTFRHGYANYVFEVRDNGIGMSKEFMQHIFEPFTRETTATISGIQGTGLGMAITRNIIEMMNGKVEVESEPGKGSVFTVTLTLKLADRQNQEKRIAQLQGIRVLVIDDDVNVCASVNKMLGELGMRPEWTNSGKDAVERAQAACEAGESFGTFILDWQMPEQSGLETARRIRAIVGEETPIIILTAYDWAEIEEEALAAGVTAFCAKPLFMSDLRNALLTSHKLLGQSEAQEKGVPDFGQRRILLVDDLEMNREVAEFILEENGFQVEMAPDGTDAVEMVSKSPEGYYDAILMDVQMPIMNGYEATRAIRNMSRKDVGKMPIIAMTANALEEDRAAALKCGMNAHIAKPIDLDKFLEVMLAFFPAEEGSREK